ncbi:MAG: hypothetical protein WCS20_06400, partial [Alphaproteobacteria bacterium]
MMISLSLTLDPHPHDPVGSAPQADVFDKAAQSSATAFTTVLGLGDPATDLSPIRQPLTDQPSPRTSEAPASRMATPARGSFSLPDMSMIDLPPLPLPDTAMPWLAHPDPAALKLNEAAAVTVFPPAPLLATTPIPVYPDLSIADSSAFDSSATDSSIAAPQTTGHPDTNDRFVPDDSQSLPDDSQTFPVASLTQTDPALLPLLAPWPIFLRQQIAPTQADLSDAVPAEQTPALADHPAAANAQSHPWSQPTPRTVPVLPIGDAQTDALHIAKKPQQVSLAPPMRGTLPAYPTPQHPLGGMSWADDSQQQPA